MVVLAAVIFECEQGIPITLVKFKSGRHVISIFTTGVIRTPSIAGCLWTLHKLHYILFLHDSITVSLSCNCGLCIDMIFDVTVLCCCKKFKEFIDFANYWNLMLQFFS